MTVVHEHDDMDGNPRLVEVIASPLWGADGSFQGIIEALRDITGRSATQGMLVSQTAEMTPDELQQFSSKVVESIQHFFARLPAAS